MRVFGNRGRRREPSSSEMTLVHKKGDPDQLNGTSEPVSNHRQIWTFPNSSPTLQVVNDVFLGDKDIRDQ